MTLVAERGGPEAYRPGGRVIAFVMSCLGWRRPGRPEKPVPMGTGAKWPGPGSIDLHSVKARREGQAKAPGNLEHLPGVRRAHLAERHAPVNPQGSGFALCDRRQVGDAAKDHLAASPSLRSPALEQDPAPPGRARDALGHFLAVPAQPLNGTEPWATNRLRVVEGPCT